MTGWKPSRTSCTGIDLGEEILRERLNLGLLNGGGLVRSAVKRLERLGYKVTFEPTYADSTRPSWLAGPGSEKGF
jgi:hypothetical protein